MARAADQRLSSSFRAPSTCSSCGPCSGGRSTATASARRSAQQSDELLKVETGSLYPALHRLVKRGWLKAEWGVSDANQRAKYYQLTAAGKAQLVRERIAGRSWWTRSDGSWTRRRNERE